MASFFHTGTYTCSCGKVFTNSQSFNGHKGHCKDYLTSANYTENQKNRVQAILNRKQIMAEQAKLQQTSSLAIWKSEEHKCANCGKIMTQLYGSGKYCSSACAHHKREKLCLNCGNLITSQKAKKFCCKECSDLFKSKEHYKNYLADNTIAFGQQNMQHYKKFFLEEQNHKCAICGCLDVWNNKQLVFILDHIDGNADNNIRTNLRLVCPNCDSQLDTYKSKNKHSARAKYRQQKHS